MKNRNILDALINSRNGIRELFKEKAAIREAWLILLSLLTVYLFPSIYSILLLVIAILLLSIEAINTSIEKLCNYITPAINEEVKKVKDLAAGAILLLVVLYSGIFFIVIGKHFQLGIWLVVRKNAIQNYISSNAAELLLFTGITLLTLTFFKNKKRFWAIITFIFGLFFQLISKPLVELLNKFGLDSYSEAKNFDINEAIFWIKGFVQGLEINFDFKNHTLLIVLAFLTTYFLIFKSRITKKYFLSTYLIALLLIGYGAYLLLNEPIQLLIKNSNEYINIKNNFDNKSPNIISDNNPLTLTIYIGESTSIMNMGIYGYPRKTTPQLQKFKDNDTGFLMFNNVFSTHTHTSPSLLEALSFGINEDDKYLPINERKRLSIVDLIINAENTNVSFYNNQSFTGLWNLTSSVIFKNEIRFRDPNFKGASSKEQKLQRPFDDIYFETIEVENNRQKKVNFLHSYAGHGPYLKNIPKIYGDVIDNTFNKIDKRAIVGNGIDVLSEIENYDSAIKYIDYSVSKTLQKIKNSKEPNIFIYFSDHGESAYTGRGHDSSKLTHEMLRVPFIIYFNEPARNLYPKKYDLYLALSKTNETATLNQLPSTIIDLLGLKIDELSENKVLQKTLIGGKTGQDPIVVRRLYEHVTFVNLDKKTELAEVRNFVDKTDDATQIYVARKKFVNKDIDICYHRSNSLGKAIRGSLLTNCIEIDLFVKDATKELFVFHPPEPNVYLDFKKLYDHAIQNKLSIWIDGKNLTEKGNCETLSKFLRSQKKHKSKLLVEFPSGSFKNKVELNDCINELLSDGYAISYYVPTVKAVQCSKELKTGQIFESISSCIQLQIDLQAALDSKIFTDISFDYRGIDAIRKIDFVKKFKWNTWHVKADQLVGLINDDFRMIIISNEDPNNI
jgi:glucan phosphoethanolaminetransferase (alkaline phosphatase superfamily)/diacylglycerol kinase